ncbi:MAG: hypothetical protein KAJ69_00060 [Thermoplasmatales archaeon]|nr:hypothetical protein [Thermoplasmatales archaeon]
MVIILFILLDKVTARDMNSAESDWAILEVTMPKNNKSISAPFLKYDWLIILIIRSALDGI